MNDINENIEEHNQNKERKILIIFDDMITNMLSNKKRNPVVTELFFSGRKLNVSPVFYQIILFSLRKNLLH